MSWLRLIEESIDEKSKPADSPAPPKKAGWNRIGHLIGEMWPAYLIEILVIILGISITLALEEWREDRKEAKLEKVYLANLSTDIDADLQMLKATQNATQQILQKGDDLLQFIRDPKQHPLLLSAINSDVRAILGRPKFVIQDATFSDLKSSGNLALLKDIPLKNLLFSYYNLTQVIKEDQDAEQQATITLSGPFFLKQFSLVENASPVESAEPEKLSGSAEFQNNVLLRTSNRNELLHLYQAADSMATALHMRLAKE